MTRTILVAGTASHVGKSTVAAGLCRALVDRGLAVAPFKAQNMSNNAQVALTPEGTWGEIGVSQFVQAHAARVPPTTDMNPVLLKPRGDGESQLIIHGTAVEHITSRGYYEDHWERARAAAITAYDRLTADHDVVVAEGAGSVAEINLREFDLANAETAQFADAEIIILVDIDRGGAFASLFGTLELAPPEIRKRIVGAVITKFRGDRSLLDPGIEEIEAKTGVPILGVLPFTDPGLPAEDSVSLPGENERAVIGTRDSVSNDDAVTVAVVRLPRISNFTDFEPLARQPGVRVAYVPITGTLSSADAVILPGTKNTVDDLLALRETNFDAALTSFDGPIVGICGGYQMLGERITNAGIESTGDHDEVAGLGLLPVVTRFDREKQVERTSRSVTGSGLLDGAEGTVTGYEIHMGDSRPTEPLESPLGEPSALRGNVFGTYLHGLFENQNVRDAFLKSVFEAAGVQQPTQSASVISPYDRAAQLVNANIDLAPLGLT